MSIIAINLFFASEVPPMNRLVLSFALVVFAFAPQTVAQAPTKAVTTPKEHFGFNMGDDYHLANYKQLQSYWTKLEGQTDRLKVVSIGKTEEGRDHLMAIVSSPANMKKLDRYREIVRATTVEDVQAMAKEYLRPEGLKVVLVGDPSLFDEAPADLGPATVLQPK